MEKIDTVSFEVAKLIREHEFDEMCRECYIPAYLHDGEPIDEDEEFELKVEGRGDEIEIVEGGSMWRTWNKNSTNSDSVYSAPTLWGMMEHIRKNHNIHIAIDYMGFFEHGEVWGVRLVNMQTLKETKIEDTWGSFGSAADGAIKFVYKNLVK